MFNCFPASFCYPFSFINFPTFKWVHPWRSYILPHLFSCAPSFFGTLGLCCLSFPGVTYFVSFFDPNAPRSLPCLFFSLSSLVTVFGHFFVRAGGYGLLGGISTYIRAMVVWWFVRWWTLIRSTRSTYSSTDGFRWVVDPTLNRFLIDVSWSFVVLAMASNGCACFSEASTIVSCCDDLLQRRWWLSLFTEVALRSG